MADPDPRPRGDHYFSEVPDAAHERGTVALRVGDVSLDLATDSGVFSRERIDPGTKLLLVEGGRPAADGTGGTAPQLLDLGCGYGPIALALASRAPAATVWAVDVNERARDLCRENAMAAGVGARVRVVAPDEVPDDVVLDGIWSNPPIRIGKAGLHDLLARWLPRLTPGASAWLVVQRHLGSDSLARWLEGRGHRVERVASRSGYRVLRVDRIGDIP